MNEAMNTSVEQELTGDAFLEGLDNAEEPRTADQPEEGAEAETREETPDTTGDATGADNGAHSSGEGKDADTPTDTGEGAEEAGADTGEGPGEGRKDEAPSSWNIKHMGAQRTITASEITPELLQKGMDYDRVRERYDEAKPMMEMFGQFAQRAGMSVTDYTKQIRAQAMRVAGMSEAEARRTVELEDREAAVAAREAEEQRTKEAESRERTKAATDVAEFAKAFPDVFAKAKDDPNVIAQRVWEDVKAGMSLSAAYSRYAVAEAEAKAQEAQTTAKNAANAARATGSLRSAGRDGKNADPFLDGFDD